MGLSGDCGPVAKQPGIEFRKGLRRFSPGKIGRRALFDERIPILLSLSCPIDTLDAVPKALGMVAIIYETTPLPPHGVEISNDLSKAVSIADDRNSAIAERDNRSKAICS